MEEVLEEKNVPTKSKKDAFMEYARSKYEGFDPEDEVKNVAALMETMTSADKSNQMLLDAIESDPRFAQILSDIVNKKRGALAAMARYVGKDAFTAEGADADEIEAAEQERMAELEREKASKAEYEKNLEASVPNIEAAAEQCNMTVDEWLTNAYEQIVVNIFNGNYTKETCERISKALTYDKDVEEAFQAGSVKTKNEKIDKMRKDVGDGLPKMGVASGNVPPTTEVKERFKVRNKSAWDK